jgi:hypothetical protein
VSARNVARKVAVAELERRVGKRGQELLRVDKRIILKWILKYKLGGCELINVTRIREQLHVAMNTSEFHIIRGIYNTADLTLQIRWVYESVFISKYMQFI